jgi:hypothetical protein
MVTAMVIANIVEYLGPTGWFFCPKCKKKHELESCSVTDVDNKIIDEDCKVICDVTMDELVSAGIFRRLPPGE